MAPTRTVADIVSHYLAVHRRGRTLKDIAAALRGRTGRGSDTSISAWANGIRAPDARQVKELRSILDCGCLEFGDVAISHAYSSAATSGGRPGPRRRPTLDAASRPLPGDAADDAFGGAAERPVDGVERDIGREYVVEVPCGGAVVPIVVHCRAIELLHDVDVLVSPVNTFLEISLLFKATVSARIRSAGAQKDMSGAFVDDVIGRELAEWRARNSRPGLPVAVGTVAATSPGELAHRGIRRIMHVAVASPRPGTNEYDVDPSTLPLAVHEVFNLARQEQDRHEPALRSICFPLLGAGRGQVDPATSFTWMWSAIREELGRDPGWRVHLATRKPQRAHAIHAELVRRSAGAAHG